MRLWMVHNYTSLQGSHKSKKWFVKLISQDFGDLLLLFFITKNLDAVTVDRLILKVNQLFNISWPNFFFFLSNYNDKIRPFKNSLLKKFSIRDNTYFSFSQICRETCFLEGISQVSLHTYWANYWAHFEDENPDCRNLKFIGRFKLVSLPETILLIIDYKTYIVHFLIRQVRITESFFYKSILDLDQTLVL